MLIQDLRYAVRSLWHSKGFATVAILCLGFGIGLNTAIFSIVDGVVLKPYPYTDPDRIVVLGEQNQKSGDEAGLSFLDMRDWKEASSSFTTIAGSHTSLTIADGAGEPERLLGALISWDLFPFARHRADPGPRFQGRRGSAQRRGRRPPEPHGVDDAIPE